MSECASEAEEKEAAVLPTLPPITWAGLQSRKGGWQAAILSLHQDLIADGMPRMLVFGCWEVELYIFAPTCVDSHFQLRPFGVQSKNLTLLQ